MQKMKRSTDLASETSKADNTKMPAAVFENLQMYHDAITSIEVVMEKVFEVPFEERQDELSALDRAKVELMNIYAINSMFWMYLCTKGETPTEHPVKAEMDRVKNYMDLVKDVVDRQKAARLDAGAAKRMVKHSLWNPDEHKATLRSTTQP